MLESSSRAVLRGTAVAIHLIVGTLAWTQTNNECDQPGEAPDLIQAHFIGNPVRWGTVGGVTAFSIGTIACNVGTCWMRWDGNTNQHPVIAQNLFRLKDGRFEQIGQAWIKHGFAAAQFDDCSPDCLASPTMTRLGVNCSDGYTGAGQNGTQSIMSRKTEVNPFTGEFPYPPADLRQEGDAIYKRLQVHNVDLDTALNPGAKYYLEVQYIGPDDAQAGNGGNNTSHRPVVAQGTGAAVDLTYGAGVWRLGSAIESWQVADPAVQETQVMPQGDGRFNVSAKATDLGDGFWRYEYAVHNLDSHRAGGLFRVPLPNGVAVRNIGFHDVDYHSGDFIDAGDWPAVIEPAPRALRWNCDAPNANPAANAIRWGTLYNFRLEADAPPAAGSLTLGLWRPGVPDAVSVATVVPELCNFDGTCGAREDCLRCPSDCTAPGPFEAGCGNGLDDDCDGLSDCADADCCSDVGCLAAFDADGDAHAAACDCDDAVSGAWSVPGEALELILLKNEAGECELGWNAPSDPGGTAVAYDVLRTSVAPDFDAAASCLTAPDPALPSLIDQENPAPLQAFYYLVRARNGCPLGTGTLGETSAGVARLGRACP